MGKTHEEEINKVIKEFESLDEKMVHLSTLVSLASWDSKTKAPKKGRAQFAKSIGAVSTEIFKLSISEEMGNVLHKLTKDDVYDQLDATVKAKVRERLHTYERQKAIPEDFYRELAILKGEANNAWEDARANNEFNTYRPYLERMFDYTKKVAEYYGYENHPYDALMDDYEPGLSVSQLDPIFKNLRNKSVNLLNRIQQKAQPSHDFLKKTFDVDKQEQFLLRMLPKLGYDLESGRLDSTAHPFAISFNLNDARITTRYDKDNIRFAIFSTIHEAGHALYELGIKPEFESSVLRRGTSLGIHESQSRFLENMVGRTSEFWQYFYDDLKHTFPHQLNNVSTEEFYRAVNMVEPSLIRVEADELTYNLHVMIRYEIEKALISGEIQVKDLPTVWNEKMEEYLGIVPQNDRDGVLQDVHWSFGAIGYFPTYSLGNLYAAQILNTITTNMPDFYTTIKQGEFLKVREWLRLNIHQYGKLHQPIDLIQKVTGETLQSNYLVDYLEDKYTKLYQL